MDLFFELWKKSQNVFERTTTYRSHSTIIVQGSSKMVKKSKSLCCGYTSIKIRFGENRNGFQMVNGTYAQRFRPAIVFEQSSESNEKLIN